MGKTRLRGFRNGLASLVSGLALATASLYGNNIAEAQSATSNRALHPKWQREYGAIVNGQYLGRAYSAGIWHSKPSFVDIDNDGDYDMFVGEGGRGGSGIHFYRNDGTPESPFWISVTRNYNNMRLWGMSVPAFCDIDNDGDFDMFMPGGDEHPSNTIRFYRNDGTPESPSWTLVTDNYNSIRGDAFTTFTFCDIDNDKDYDMFVGDLSSSNMRFYRNDGIPESPNWTLVTDNYSVKGYDPAFCDIDNDGDLDAFTNNWDIFFWENKGSQTEPLWAGGKRVTDEIGSYSSPTLVDIDNDKDYDMFVSTEGRYMSNCASKIYFYRNDGTPTSPSWNLVTNSYISLGMERETNPTFCDIDDDDDYDMFISGGINRGSEWEYSTYFYRNDGTPKSPSWTFVTDNYNPMEKGGKVSFVDIDNDGDFDMFHRSNFYRNDGTPESPSWTLVTDNYNSIIGYYPAFCDIDNDGDHDMFTGHYSGSVCFCRNDGTPTSPSWTFVTDKYNSIDVGWDSIPVFCDIEGDNDYDLFVGNRDGNLNFYRNDGTPETPTWIFVTDKYNDIFPSYVPPGVYNFIGKEIAPAFCDIDKDGDYDMFAGNYGGGVGFWRNMATEMFVDIEKYENDVRLKFKSEEGSVHKIYKSSDLENWVEADTITSTGINEWLDKISDGKIFYRISFPEEEK